MFARRFQHDVVDSTSERAFAALAAGTAQHGDVHLARAQTAGRGRRGRRWESTANEGLYLSAILLPGPPAYRPPILTVATGLAVREAAQDAGVLGARLDWPNDVVARGAKLAGILVETRGLDPARPHYVVGIGVNVLQREFSPALSSERAVTSLALEGARVALDDFAEMLFARLATRLASLRSDPTVLATDYLAATGLLGRRVNVRRTNEELLAGELLGLDFAKGLVLAPDQDGLPRRVALETIDALAPA